MKRIKLLVVIALFTTVSCQKDESTEIAGSTKKNSNPRNSSTSLMRTTTGPFSQFISIDSANKMIGSYLLSINYPQNDSDLRAFIFNADSLRSYLNDTANGRIREVKFILAHTPAYMNAGNYGVNAGYQTGNLTIIVAGYDQNNNYIYHHGNTVLEHAMPCPYNCPSSGTAGGPLLH